MSKGWLVAGSESLRQALVECETGLAALQRAQFYFAASGSVYVNTFSSAMMFLRGLVGLCREDLGTLPSDPDPEAEGLRAAIKRLAWIQRQEVGVTEGVEMVVITKFPSDYPDSYVVRRHAAFPDRVFVDAMPIAVVDTLEQAREAVPERFTGPFAPDEDDDPVIAEIWL